MDRLLCLEIKILFELSIIVTAIVPSKDYVLAASCTSSGLALSGKYLTDKWADLSLLSPGTSGGDWSLLSSSKTMLRQVEEVLLTLFNLASLDEASLRKSLSKVPIDGGTGETVEGAIVKNLMTEYHWNESLTAVDDSLRFAYSKYKHTMVAFIDDVAEIAFHLTIRDKRTSSSTLLIRIKLPTLS